jgi:survival of motor neuron protein-interacting protein 1
MNQPCLPVPRRRKRKDDNGGVEEVSFANIESMDAMEYMAAVMKQANAMPEVFVSQEPGQPQQQSQQHANHVPIEGSAASLQYLVSDRTAVLPPPTAQHVPSRAWVDGTLANFSSLRSYLDTCHREGVGGKLTQRTPVPPMKDRTGWHFFCVGQDEARGNVGSYFEDEVDKDTVEKQQQNYDWQVPPNGHEPSLELLLQLDQVMIRKVLSHLAHYAYQGWSVSVKRTAWLYALLSRLERPIHRDDAATLFGLLKCLAQFRSKVVDPSSSDELARLNVLVCIIGLYFEQGGGFDNIFTC